MATSLSSRPRTRLRALTALLSFAWGCRDLALAPASARPTVAVLAPSEGQAVTFDTPFAVSARALAPAGAALTRVELVVRADQGRGRAGSVVARSLPASGVDARVDAALAIPGLGHLGPDQLSAELLLVAYALVDGKERASQPALIPLSVVDRTRPELEVTLTPTGSPPPPGFDGVYPAGTPFALRITARDAVGGVAEVAVRAPGAVGGDRVRRLSAPRSEASLEVAFAPPENADLELVVSARDAAVEANVAERTLRVRVGRGGIDRQPPTLSFVAPDHAECGADTVVQALASDDLSGMDRMTLRGPGAGRTAHGPDPMHPLSLTLSARLGAESATVSGAPVSFEATARDLAGNEAAPAELALEVLDTRPPVLAAVVDADPSIGPGTSWSATVQGEEACTVVRAARATFTDPAGARAVAEAALQTAAVDARVRFEVPPGLCALGSITATVALIDATGLASPPVLLRPRALDPTAPEVAVQFLAPAGGLMPGELAEVEGHALDLETPVRSATLTVSTRDLRLTEPLAVATARYRATLCAERGERVVLAPFAIPPDVRFTAPEASLVFQLDATSGAGRGATTSLVVPVRDLAPPEVALIGPSDRSVVGPGDRVSLEVSASDLNHDVQSLVVSARGPVSLGPGGSASATVAIGAATGSAHFELWVDPLAGLDTPISVVARARDTSNTAPPGEVRLELVTCGIPTISAVTPALGPSSGDARVELHGLGFSPGHSQFELGELSLVDVVVDSPTHATARVPPGAWPAGAVSARVTNRCGQLSPSAARPDAYRFIAPPTLSVLAPAAGATATPGALLPVTVIATSDGGTLAELRVALSTGASATQTGPGAALTVDDALVIPADASGSVELTATAVDALGQTSARVLMVALAAPTPLALWLDLDRAIFATGERVPFSVRTLASDGAVYDVTAEVSLDSSVPRVLGAPPGEAPEARAAGTATLTATLGALAVSQRVTVVDRALVFGHGPLYLSSLPTSGGGPSSARPAVWLLADGQATEVTPRVTLGSSSPLVAGTVGGMIVGLQAGDATLLATLTSTDGAPLQATLPVRVRPELEVGSGERWWTPPGQRFDGGAIAGTLYALREASVTGPWTLAITPGGTLALTTEGTLDARGAPGAPLGAGGHGGHRAGGGGAAARDGGARGGLGDPSGEDTNDALDATPGGAGGGRASGGGGGAPAFTPGAAGAGGAGAGRGGAGGAAAGERAALGGLPRRTGLDGGSGGGGGRRGGGGGGGGAHLELELHGATLVLAGRIDASGGGGGASLGREGTPGGGGGGGSVHVVAAALLGDGWLCARGGAGGGYEGPDGRGSGGGGGGGHVRLEILGAQSPDLRIDVRGGAARAIAGSSARRGEAGQWGEVER